MIHKVIVPESRMVNVSFTVPDSYVGEEMEVLAFIKNEISKPDFFEEKSPSLGGNPMSNQQFVDWINDSESAPTISLQEAETQWTKKRKQLLQ